MKMFSIFYKNRHPVLGRYSLLLITLSWLGEVHAQCPTLTGTNRAICFGENNAAVLDNAFQVSDSNADAVIRWYKADGTTIITNNNTDKTTLSAQDFDAAHGTTFSQNAGGVVYEVKVSQTYTGCSESVKRSVYVVQQPQLPGVAAPTSSAPANGVCNGNDITLTSDSPGDASVGSLTLKTEILWSAVADVSFSLSTRKYTSNKGYATIQINDTGLSSNGVQRLFKYVREYRTAQITTLGASFDVAACPTAESGNLTITVSPKPSGPVVTTPAASTVCPDLDFTLTLDGTTDGTIKEWVKVFGTNINSIDNTTTTLSQNLNVQGSYTYYATLIKSNTSGKSCETSTQAATVVIAGIVNNPVSISACVGENARFSSSVVVPTPGTSLTFTWEVDRGDGNGFVSVPSTMGTPSSSGGTSELTITPVLAAYNNYRYRLIAVYGGDCTRTSTAATLTIKNPPILDTGGDLSAALAVCRAEAFTLQASGTGAGQISCQWQQKLPAANSVFTDIGNVQNFSPPPSPTGFTTSFPFLAADVNDNVIGTAYRVKITDNNCTIYTTSCTLSLKEKPAFTANDPFDAAVCEGGTAAFSVDATKITKTGTIVYQWIKTAGTTDSNVGTNSNSYTTPATIMADNGNHYRVAVTDDNNCSPVASRTALLTVNPKPSITTQPADNIDKCDGSAVSFTVVATTNNGTLRYQWEEDPTRTDPETFTAIPVSTNATADKSTLTLQSVSNKDGYKYRVKLTDDKCNATSSTVRLTVNAPFSATLNPVNADVCEGQDYTYTASVNGLSATATPAYQWKKWNTSLNVFENISGAANASYTISAAPAALDGAKYAVAVTIGGTTCTQSSGTSTLHVRPYPVVDPQPQSQSLCEGDNVTFTTGGSTAQGTLTYQWQEASGTGTFSNLSGETNTTLIFTNLPGTKNGYRYQAVLNNSFCSITTGIATLTLSTPPTPGTLPSTPETCIGLVYSYTLTNSSGGTLKYQWQEESGGTFVNAGAEGTSTTYDVAASQTQTTKRYKVIVRIDNTSCKRESNVSTLTVNPLPTLTVENPVGCVGQAASITAKPSGTSPFTYQWKEGSTNVGTNSDVFVVSNNVQTTDAGRVFTVTVTDSKTCSATSSEITFVVDSPPGIGQQPNSQTVCSNEPATFSVVLAQSNPAPSLQWQEALATGAFTAIDGATGNNYMIGNTAGKNGNRYRVLASNTHCTNTSNTAILTVNDAPVISGFTPATGAVCAEKDVTYTVTATGSTPHYQWQQNQNTGTFANVGSDQHTFVMTNVTPLQSGYVTKVRVTHESNNCSAVSDLSTLTVKPLPTVAATANPAAICSITPTNVELSNPNNLSGTAYTWTVAAPATISGSSAQSTPSQGPISQILTSTATSDVTVTYTVTPSADGCEGHTADAVVTIHPHPDVQAAPDKTTFCTGGEVTITLSTPKNLASTKYKWNVNASTEVTGWQNQTTPADGPIKHTLVSSSSQSENVVYTITPTTTTPTAAGCDGPVAEITLVVQSKVNVKANLQPNVTVCPGAQMTLVVDAKGSPTLEYQWKRDGQDIANATEASYKMAVNDPDNGAKFKVSIKNPCDMTTSNETVLTVSPEVAFANTEVKPTPAVPGYLEPVSFTYRGPLPAQSFDWNFGDGTIHSTFQDPIHNYTALGPQVVNLAVTLPDNCHKTFTINLTVTGKAPDIITGDAVNQYGIGFYPVPLEEKLNVYAETQLVSVSISTITGSRMISSSVNGNKLLIDTSALTSGIYILSVETEKGIAHFKVVK